ncbi:hypothetical protein [Rhodococcus sp. AD45]|uniref:hypothetical protein n=1 Tax=Rhodococcus sp. (strain AD45) TaxID=103808 RepID=UPI0005DB48BC|nr:hypothetical protein [Rhodococcus sp. AD45]KJF19417.1 hypothetical protein SZ00_06344 [Rhodococcus sp. AD45]
MNSSHSGSDDLPEIPLEQVIARTSNTAVSPPPAIATELPFAEISPPVFEKLVAEVVLSVDRLDDVHIYGRSGQNQGGLDIVGSKGDELHIYQVRRIDHLTPAALRKAVVDFAGPPHTTTPQEEWVARRFDANRFVVATGCTNDDRAVTDELNKLKGEYRGDLELALYDARWLSIRLRHHGALVRAVFGDAWSTVFCGYIPPSGTGVGDGHGLLNDPLEILGLSDDVAKARAVEDTAPAESAQIYQNVAGALRDASLPFANTFDDQATAMFRKAGNTAEAFTRTVDSLINRCTSAQWLSDRLRTAIELAETLGPDAADLLSIIKAADSWFTHGFDLEPVVGCIDRLTTSDHPLVARTALLVAEEVLTDEDPADDVQRLADALEKLPNQLSGQELIRLRCCIADLRIRGGTTAKNAYAVLYDEAVAAAHQDPTSALIERRYGRALAQTDNFLPAQNAYRRAVVDAARATLGADVRDGLRSIAGLAYQPSLVQYGGTRAMEAARATTNTDQLIFGIDQASIVALESLADDNVSDAVRQCHHWLRLERISGSYYDERIARRHYAQALLRADQHAHSIRQLVQAGETKRAASATADLTSFVDFTDQLRARSADIRTSSSAVHTALADLIPDIEVERIASLLEQVFTDSHTPESAATNESIHSLEAIAALRWRIPTDTATRIQALVRELLPREPGHYRFTDRAVLKFLSACTESSVASVISPAIEMLVETLRYDFGNVDHYISALDPSLPGLQSAIEELAASGNAWAVNILSGWGIGGPSVRELAIELAAKLIAEPVDVPRSQYINGNRCTLAAERLTSALTSVPAHNAPDLEVIGIMEQYVSNLIRRIEDRHAIAEERADAAIAFRVLKEHLSEQTRSDVWSRILDVYDTPGEHPSDEWERRSNHPLSNFRVNSGGNTFRPELLWTCALLATTSDETQAVRSRLRREMARPAGSPTVAEVRARTALAVEIDSTDLIVEMLHQSEPDSRKAAAVLWTRDPHREPEIGSILAHDKNRGVRATLGKCLHDSGIHDEYPHLLKQLSEDSSATVRRAARPY